MNHAACPITGSLDTELLGRSDFSITSDGDLRDNAVENRISLATGLIFNAQGARGGERAFYEGEYNLQNDSADTEFEYFDRGASRGIHDDMVDFITTALGTRPAGRVLDIGCGKGLFLRRFLDRHAGWTACGIEPSHAAAQHRMRLVPDAVVDERALEDSRWQGEVFDLVAANGVLEHVPAPLAFLHQFRAAIAPGGLGYIGVPNFANNPADLFTYDHLSRFTPASLSWLFALAGLDIVTLWAPDSRVPMWAIVRPGEPRELPVADVLTEGRALAAAAAEHITETVEGLRQALDSAASAGTHPSLFGTGMIGALALRATGTPPTALSAIYDDNRTLTGAVRQGHVVRHSSAIPDDGARHFVIAANPCYHASITARIESLTGATARIWPVPALTHASV